MMKKDKYVIVTTLRGAFAGRLEGEPSPEGVTLLDGRMLVYWDQESRGIPGLAQDGPSGRCRVSPPVPRMDILGSATMPITLVMECTEIAREKFEAGPWG